MAGPRLSVALCTYNGEAYLLEQLASIAQQTLAIDEIVVADDGSTDSTRELLGRAHGDIPGLRILPPAAHQGVTRNFERAISATTGDVIILSDQDDRWHPDRAALAVAALAADADALLIHSDARVVDAQGRPTEDSLLDRLRVDPASRRELVAGHAFPLLMRRNLVTGATVAFRRGLLETALPFPDAWLHDEWLAAIAASTAGTRMLESTPVDYRMHGGNEVGAPQLTWGARWSRLTVPRSGRNERLLRRARQLEERLPAGEAKDLAADKVRHEEARSSYPAVRAARGPSVLRELRTGRYSRFGRGLEDVLRDLVQPVR
jgi:glycosyltransferase involved in cell wall biosynthesis